MASPKRTARRASASLSAQGPFVTFVLIGVNVGVFMLQLVMGSGIGVDQGWIYENGVLFGPLVAEGEWWRLVTSAFLHGNILHLGMNMLVLWLIGPPLEDYLGHGRYALLYLVSGLAGAAGRARLVTALAGCGCVGRHLGDHGRRVDPRVAQDLRVRRTGDGPRRLQPRLHVPNPRYLHRWTHRGADRRRARRARIPVPAPTACARHGRGRRGGRAQRRSGVIPGPSLRQPPMASAVTPTSASAACAAARRASGTRNGEHDT